MSFLTRIMKAFGPYSGPYGEDPWSMIRKNRSMRSQPLDEDHLQGQGNRDFLRQSCLDLYRVSGLAHAAVTRIADYSTVCTPYPATSDDKWNAAAFDWFQDWRLQADYRRRPGVDLCDIVHMIHIADHLIGETFFMPTDTGQLQPIEADRIATPNDYQKDPMVIDGIRINGSGVITDYYVCRRKPDGSVDRTSWTAVKAKSLFQVVDPWRIDQLHGIPRIHAAVKKLADYDETDEAMRAKVKNEAMRFFQTESQLPLGGGRTTTGGGTGTKYKIIKTDIGQIWDGAKLDTIESKSPNATYTTHMIEEARAVAAACDIPYEYLMMIYTAGSYNAQKGARLAFRDTCWRRADHVNKWFLQRVWNWRIPQAIKAGDLPPAPITVRSDGLRVSEWNRVRWAMPRFEDIDLGSDVSAKSAAWAAGQQSLRDQRENPYQILEGKASDILRADEIAERLNAQLKTGQVTWQHIINAGVPGLTIEPAKTESKEPEKEEAEDESEESE
jgi:capsid protein